MPHLLNKLACVQETVLNRCRSILTDVFARADSSLDRRALQRELDLELLGSSKKRKQLLYIKNPFNFFSTEICTALRRTGATGASENQ